MTNTAKFFLNMRVNVKAGYNAWCMEQYNSPSRIPDETLVEIINVSHAPDLYTVITIQPINGAYQSDLVPVAWLEFIKLPESTLLTRGTIVKLNEAWDQLNLPETSDLKILKSGMLGYVLAGPVNGVYRVQVLVRLDGKPDTIRCAPVVANLLTAADATEQERLKAVLIPPQEKGALVRVQEGYEEAFRLQLKREAPFHDKQKLEVVSGPNPNGGSYNVATLPKKKKSTRIHGYISALWIEPIPPEPPRIPNHSLAQIQAGYSLWYEDQHGPAKLFKDYDLVEITEYDKANDQYHVMNHSNNGEVWIPDIFLLPTH